MQVLFLLSCLLVASAMEIGSMEFMPGEQLQEVRESFREELRRLIEANGEKAAPLLQDIESKIQECNGRLETTWSPCRECVKTTCDVNVANELEMKFAVPASPSHKRFWSSSFWDSFNLASSWTSNFLSGSLSTASNTVSNTVTNAVDATSNVVSGAVDAASNVVSSGWKAATGWLGRRRSLDRMTSLSPETKQCLMSCDSCSNFLQNRRKDLLLSECGTDIFLEFSAIAGPMNSLKILMNANEETPLLVKLAFRTSPNSDMPVLDVFAKFPAGEMMYESRVPFQQDDNLGSSLAREYFARLKDEHDF